MVKNSNALRAFTLMELMVVLLILVVVISIVLPALGRGRTAAQRAATLATFNSLSTASQAFRNDENRLPGYFSQDKMGKSDNAGRGFSQMENIMLDLAGGVADGPGANAVQVGPLPTADGQVYVDLTLIGASTQSNGAERSQYFVPDAKSFVRGPDQEAGPWQVTSVPAHRELPDLVDAFGAPILAWLEDDGVGANTDFAAENTSSTAARFYWTPNAAFLNSPSCGSRGVDQRFTPTSNPDGSLLSSAFSAQQRAGSLAGLLGNPAFPDPIDSTIPGAARGGLVFHSAGPNGVYLGRNEAGGKIAMGASGGAQGIIAYGRPGPDGKAIDPMESFDDILQVSGN